MALRGVAELILACADLLGAELRSLRLGLVNVALAVGLVLAALALLLGGTALCLWSVYLMLSRTLTQSAAALITGLLGLALAALFGWAAQRRGR